MSDGFNPGEGKSGRKTATEAIACIAEVLVDMGRHSEFDEGTIRRRIRRAFVEALEDDVEFHEMIDPNVDGPIFMVGPAGMFRLVFDEWDLDRQDQFMQESWYVIVERAMDQALARTDPRDL